MNAIGRLGARYGLLLTLIVALAGCRTGSEPVLFGSDSCHHCKMIILDRRFGGEIVSRKGKVYKFDSLECLRGFQKAHAGELANDAKIFVLEGSGSGELLAADDARFTEDKNLRAPMGRPFIARKSGATAGQPALSWSEVAERLNP